MQKEKGGLVKQSVKRKVMLRVRTESERRVFVAGTLSEWNPCPHAMKRGGDEYRATITLPAGRHGTDS